MIMTYGQAIRAALEKKMREDERVILMGEDMNFSTYGVTTGMADEFGPERVRETPISEGAIIGCATGAAATGLRPVPEIMMGDFFAVCMDQLTNQAAKLRYMFGGKFSVPMVVRTASGVGGSAAAQHSQSNEAWLAHVPGLKVVFPHSPQDAYGLMLAAIEDDNPVIFLEGKRLYSTKGEVDLEAGPIPLGVGKIEREGSDLTIVTYGKEVNDANQAADKLKEEGVSVEIVDIRSLVPLDKEIIRKSVEKTGRVIVLTEENRRAGFGAELSAMIAEEYFDYLDAPVQRIGALNTPAPFAPNLEAYWIPNAQDVVNAAHKIL